METHTLDMILTTIVLSFWFLFPIGMFLAVSKLDRDTDQVVRLDHLRQARVDGPVRTPRPLHHVGIFSPAYKTSFDRKWNLPLSFKRWIHH